MDYQAISFWWNVGITIVLAGVSVWGWFKSRSTATANDIKSLRDWTEDELDASAKNHTQLTVRVVRIESDLQHMPGHEELAELVTKMAETQSQLSRAVGELSGLNRQMRLVQEHLLSGRRESP